MISREAASERVNERLERMGEDGEQVHIVAARLLCVGTDVNGVELEEVLRSEAANVMMMVATGSPVGDALLGVLARAFWLGFEYGLEEGEA